MQLIATIRPETGFPPQLMRAATVLRMNTTELGVFLRQQDNPCLRVSGLPPPPPSDSFNIRTLLHRRRAETLISADLRPFIEYLIECVDDDGFLAIPEEFSAAVAADTTESAVAALQAFAPAGVGARDLRECLLLQLAAQAPSPARVAAETLVRDRLSWLCRKRWDKLPQRRLPEALSLLEKLSATPGTAYMPAAAAVIPDVVFIKQRGFWRATPGGGTAVRVTAVTAAGASTAQRTAAKNLAAAVAARRRWVIKLAQFAADRQSTYFVAGAAALRPLTISAAAKEYRCSVSFISHILHGKTAIFSDNGFLLKSLFPGATDHAAITGKIKNMIAGENSAHPLTDTRLCRLLAAAGCRIARRTVTKYRRQAGLAPASLRKRLGANTNDYFSP